MECGKTITNGAAGIFRHYTPDEGGCPAMELRSINWTLQNDPPRGEGAADRIATLKRRRIALTLKAESEGRGESLAPEVPAETRAAVERIVQERAEKVSKVPHRNRVATAPGT